METTALAPLGPPKESSILPGNPTWCRYKHGFLENWVAVYSRDWGYDDHMRGFLDNLRGGQSEILHFLSIVFCNLPKTLSVASSRYVRCFTLVAMAPPVPSCPLLYTFIYTDRKGSTRKLKELANAWG
jgi:hypothetical protein